MKPAILFILMLFLTSALTVSTAYGKACNSDLDCDFGSGSSCEEGICVGGQSGCRSDIDCDFGAGESCQRGICEGGTPECRSDIDCEFGRGERCSGGHCRGIGGSLLEQSPHLLKVMICSQSNNH